MMLLFEQVIGEVRGVAQAIRSSGVHEAVSSESAVLRWPAGQRGSIVMKSETAVELGSPDGESVAILLWTPDLSLVSDGTVTLLGPDLRDTGGEGLPFGKVVLLGVEGFDETTCFEYHRELELLRFDMNLDGYMMRAVSQRGREWGRVARDAVAGGFSLMTLGAESARMYRKSPHVKSVEILMVTSSAGDVRMLFAPAEKASRLIGAMSKMSEELSFDCGECSYRDVCDEVEGLRSMRGTLRSEKKMI